VQLRAALNQAVGARGGQVFYPPADLCTDNGAMIAYAGYMRLTQMHVATNAIASSRSGDTASTLGLSADLLPQAPLRARPRWDLCAPDGPGTATPLPRA
jgi:hypothetical protein